MNLCSDGHEEICYEGRECPLCEVITRRNDQIEQLEDQIADLKIEIGELLQEPQTGG